MSLNLMAFILFYVPQIFGNYLETRIWSHSGWKLYQLCSHSNEDECYLYQYICDLDVFGFYVYYSLYHLGLFQFENVARNAKSFWWELLGSTLLLGYSNLFLYIPNLFWFYLPFGSSILLCTDVVFFKMNAYALCTFIYNTLTNIVIQLIFKAIKLQN